MQDLVWGYAESVDAFSVEIMTSFATCRSDPGLFWLGGEARVKVLLVETNNPGSHQRVDVAVNGLSAGLTLSLLDGGSKACGSGVTAVN